MNVGKILRKKKIAKNILSLCMKSKETLNVSHVIFIVFTESGSLKRHKKIIHEEIKNFKCNYCGKTFAVKGDLDKHRAYHENRKEHKCDSCKKDSITKMILIDIFW